jgi:hypothetical protein
MTVVGNFQKYIIDRAANELNTCPHCGVSPVRIVPSGFYGASKYECTTERCPNYCRQLSMSFDDDDSSTHESHSDPGDTRPVYLWCNHHHDFGDI